MGERDQRERERERLRERERETTDEIHTNARTTIDGTLVLHALRKGLRMLSDLRTDITNSSVPGSLSSVAFRMAFAVLECVLVRHGGRYGRCGSTYIEICVYRINLMRGRERERERQGERGR